jgi:hypothetical protein
MRKTTVSILLVLFIISAGIATSFAENTTKQIYTTQTNFNDTVKQFIGKEMAACVGTYCLDGKVKEVTGSCLILEKKNKKYYINIDNISYFEIY